jgi:hypothetical protein
MMWKVLPLHVQSHIHSESDELFPIMCNNVNERHRYISFAVRQTVVITSRGKLLLWDDFVWAVSE